MSRLFFILASLSAFLGVALGAFAAHVLRNRLAPEMFNIFEVGVRYQIYHAFALFVVVWASARWETGNFSISGWMFIFGTVLFSGSLYILSLSGMRWLGAITPVGGLCFLLGWFFLALEVYKTR